jgi:ribose transport system permease protein
VNVSSNLRLRVLDAVPLLLLVVVLLGFGAVSPRFLAPANLLQILVQASSLGIVAVGMTLVLLTGGVDLSAGSLMFLSAGVSGWLVLHGFPLSLALAAALATGLIAGFANGLLVSRLRLMPFVVTLATLYLWRGLGLNLTQTRAMNLPEGILRLAAARVAGVPAPVWILAGVLASAHLLLSRTQFGRQIYAAGNDPAGARRAGVPVARILTVTYTACGLCAALGGLVAVAQLGAVSPTFGSQREFAAIAAAVLGGASLFGGRGTAFPGTLIGAVLIQSIENGLVVTGADPYLFPLITAAVIFAAVFLDSVRRRNIENLRRRKVRGPAAPETSSHWKGVTTDASL